jgi:PLP dependent protein
MQDVLISNIASVQRRMASACEKSRRETAEVKLIAVSKTIPTSLVRLAVEAGITDFGENLVQEAHSKFHELRDIRQQINLHMIGHIQTNKVKAALEIGDIFHSVDSLKLADLINKDAVKKVPVLVQVNVAGEETKYGFTEADLNKAIAHIKELPNIHILGLMTIAPLTSNVEEVRPVFSRLYKLNRQYGFKELSMGMSNDYEVAIEEGATMLRIGRAIFGERRL